MALDLMMDRDGVSGIVGLDTQDLSLTVIRARAVILGTGGIGQLFPVTSNPNDVTGDGLALAYRAGAILRDLEFVQFYPWRLISHVRSRMPVQPSSFAAGAILRNASGDRFMAGIDAERKEATTRDFAARGIYTEIVEGRGVEGGVVLDLSEIPVETFNRLNPRVARFFEQKGLDLTREQLILAPEGHYHMGGLRIDEHALSTLPHLYAVGEVAAGIHGGNRLDSNEIPSGQVFGRRGGIAASASAKDRPEPQIDQDRVRYWQSRLADVESGASIDVKDIKNAIRDTMWRAVGIIRNGRTIEQGIGEADALTAQLAAGRPSDMGDLPEYIEAENMALVASLVTRAASLRTESRSAHYREDYPTRNDGEWLANIDVCRNEATDRPELVKRPVEVEQPHQ
jgi:fumarate reductase (CoM/CoB) subunit A